MITHATNQSFKELIDMHDTVLVDFFATWCGPCQMLAAEMEKIKDRVAIIKVDVDECMALAAQYQIDVVPTILIFKEQKLVNRISGYLPAEEILRLVK